MDWSSTLVGAIGGIGSSLAASYAFQRIRPRLRWSQEISELTGRRAGLPYYRAKVVNVGRRRAVDVRVSALLRIKGLIANARSNWTLIEVPVKAPWLPILPKRLLVPLRTHDIDLRNLRDLPYDLQQKIKRRQVGLRELLDLGDDAYLELILIGYDELSGARRIAVSPRLRKDSIRHGRYGPANSLRVGRDGGTPAEADTDELDVVAADED